MQLTRRELLAGIGAWAPGIGAFSLADAGTEFHTTAADGGLDDHVLVELWHDGVPLQSRNGRLDLLETLDSPIVARSPPSVAFGPGSEVSGVDGRRVIRSLDPGQTRRLALSWSFPQGTGTNAAQGDSVSFDPAFAGGSTETASPFTGWSS